MMCHAGVWCSVRLEPDLIDPCASIARCPPSVISPPRILTAVMLSTGITGLAIAVQPASQPDDTERQVRATCGGCHAFPPPTS